MVDGNSQFLYVSDHHIYAKRHYLTKFLREKTESVIQYGLLKGYRFGASLWAEPAVGSYLLGTYEAQVCAFLDRLKSPNRTIVDIGAADGLYGIGLVAVGAYGRSICFEESEDYRRALEAHVEDLGISDKVTIYGRATAEVVKAVLEKSGTPLNDIVVLCDIEGGEFDLFDDELLRILRNTHVIIETHDFLLQEGARSSTALGELIGRAESHAQVSRIRDGLRYVRNIPLIDDWSDSDVWMMCMEGRKRMMTWLYVYPHTMPKLLDSDIDAAIYDYQKMMFS